MKKVVVALLVALALTFTIQSCTNEEEASVYESINELSVDKSKIKRPGKS